MNSLIRNMTFLLLFGLMPGLLLAAGEGGDQLLYKWQKIEKAQGYAIQFKDESGKVVLDEKSPTNSIKFSLPPGIYTHRIAILNKFSKPSSWSNWVTIKIIKPEVPELQVIQPLEIKRDPDNPEEFQKERELLIKGKNFLKATQIQIKSKEGVVPTQEIPIKEIEIRDDESIVIKTDPEKFASGDYNLVIKNPGEKIKEVTAAITITRDENKPLMLASKFRPPPPPVRMPLLDESGLPLRDEAGKAAMLTMGQPITNEEGEPLKTASGKPLLARPGLQLSTPDGKPLTDENGEALSGPTGKPLMGSIAQPLRGQDGKPLVDSEGKPLLGDIGKPLLNSDGEPILDDSGEPQIVTKGKPLTDESGEPLLGSDGQKLVAAFAGQRISPDGSTIPEPEREALPGEEQAGDKVADGGSEAGGEKYDPEKRGYYLLTPLTPVITQLRNREYLKGSGWFMAFGAYAAAGFSEWQSANNVVAKRKSDPLISVYNDPYLYPLFGGTLSQTLGITNITALSLYASRADNNLRSQYRTHRRNQAIIGGAAFLTYLTHVYHYSLAGWDWNKAIPGLTHFRNGRPLQGALWLGSFLALAGGGLMEWNNANRLSSDIKNDIYYRYSTEPEFALLLPQLVNTSFLTDNPLVGINSAMEYESKKSAYRKHRSNQRLLGGTAAVLYIAQVLHASFIQAIPPELEESAASRSRNSSNGQFSFFYLPGPRGSKNAIFNYSLAF